MKKSQPIQKDWGGRQTPKEFLRDSQLAKHWPPAVINALSTEITEKMNIEYTYPAPATMKLPHITVTPMLPRRTHIYIPNRLSMPIVKITDELIQYFQDPSKETLYNVHQHVANSAFAFRNSLIRSEKMNWADKKKTRYDIEYAKEFTKQKYSIKNDANSNIAALLTREFARADIAQAAMTAETNLTRGFIAPKFPSFLHVCHKIRTVLPIREHQLKTGQQQRHHGIEEPDIQLSNEGWYTISASCDTYQYTILVSGDFFCIAHSALPDKYIGSSIMLDYLLTHTEVSYNLLFCIRSEEYYWAKGILTDIYDLLQSPSEHAAVVQFMKNFETLCLNLSDISESTLVCWDPIIDTLAEINSAAGRITGEHTDLAVVFSEFLGLTMKQRSPGILINLIRSMKKLKGEQLQALSAIHKCSAYSEIDEDKGIDKFLKRVHTKRPVDQVAMSRMMNATKKEFCTSYASKHKKLPPLSGNPNPCNMINSSYNQGGLDKLKCLPASVWEEIDIGECLDSTLTDDPVQFAKDKGALRPMVSYGPGDSQKELVQVIKRKEYHLTPLPYTTFDRTREQSVNRQRSLRDPRKDPMATRLILKEREQKEEGRLFGNTNIENKHALSKMMILVKKALGFFDGEFMTITDESRKKRLHEAGQKLLEPNTYSILLDIEGHNQSMQYDNTAVLLEFIGKLYGESGWGNLSSYFSHLNVYFYKTYTNETIISKGQQGGIEGWMNPLWTLATLMMVKLLPEMEDLPIDQALVYSDDVNLIVKIMNTSPAYVNNLYMKIESHCSKFGMKVKLSQTAASKHRVTLLRRHYYDGIHSDTSLKKLLACTMFNNKDISSDDLEVAGIVSSISSALEMTDNPVTPTYMKWHKVILQTMRSFANVFKEKREDSMVSPDKFSPKLANLLYPMKSEGTIVTGPTGSETLQLVRSQLENYGLNGESRYYNEDTLKHLMNYFGDTRQDRFNIRREDLVIYLLGNCNELQEKYLFFLLMPQSLGGKGTMPLVSQSISGHSVGFYKQLYYSIEILKMYCQDILWVETAVEVALSSRSQEKNKFSEGLLANTHWPNNNGICTIESQIANKLKNYFVQNCINTRLLNWFKVDEHRQCFNERLVSLMREKFSTRIAQFYAENTVFYLVDTILSKVEDVMSLLSTISNKKNFRESILRKEQNNTLLLFSTRGISYGKFKITYDLIQYLVERRQTMYPLIKFIDIEEPLYDTYLIPCKPEESIIYAHLVSGITVINGVNTKNLPRMGAQALFKGEFKANDLLYSSIEEVLISKVCAVTKWILSNSMETYTDQSNYDEYNIVQMADLSLKTLCEDSFDSLKHTCDLPEGGEILHRIPNLKFSAKSYIRIMPNSMVQYVCSIRQERYGPLLYEDSNIHVDLMRNRIILAIMLKNKLTRDKAFKLEYKLKTTRVITDVRVNFVYKRDRCKDTDIVPPNLLNYKTLCTDRIKYYSYSYFTEYSNIVMSTIPTDHTSHDIYEVQEYKESKELATYISALRRNYIGSADALFEDEIWVPYINTYKRRRFAWHGKSNTEVISMIREQIYKIPELLRKHKLDNRTDIKHSFIEQQLMSALMDRSTDYTNYKASKSLLKRSDKDIANNSLLLVLNTLTKYTNSTADAVRTNILECILLEIMIRYTCIYRYDNGRLKLNKVDTEEHTLIMLNSLTVESNLQLEHEVHLFFFGIDEVLRNYTMRPYHYFNILDNWINELNISDCIIDYIGNVKADVDTIDEKYDIPNSIKNITVRSLSIDNSFYSQFHNIKYGLNIIKELSKLYANPIVLHSPTGSDSLAAQFNLFRFLQENGDMPEQLMVCDLTAGRGDGHIALTNLNIPHKSYGILDNFTAIHRIEGLDLTTKYNVMDSSTLGFTETYRHIHIDISFLKKGNMDITDTLLYYIGLKKQITIRINSIDLRGEELRIKLRSSKYESSLIYPAETSLKYYQIYLFLRPSNFCTASENDDLRQSVWLTELLISYKSMANYINFARFQIEETINSITVPLRNIIDYNALAMDLLNNEKEIKSAKIISSSIDNYYLRDLLVVNRKKIPKKFKDKFHIFESPVSEEYIKFYSELETEYTTYSSKVKWKEEHKLAILDERENNIIIPWVEQNKERIRELSYFHPIAAVRTLITNSFKMLDSQELTFGDNFMELQSRYVEYQDVLYLHNDQMTIEYRETLLLLYYSAAWGDYERGLNVLFSKYKDSLGHKTKLINKLMHYRCLGSLYLKMEQSFAYNPPDPIIVQRIFKEHIIENIKTESRKRVPKIDVSNIDTVPIDIETNLEMIDKMMTGFIDKMAGADILAPVYTGFMDIGEMEWDTQVNVEEFESLLQEHIGSGIGANLTELRNKLNSMTDEEVIQIKSEMWADAADEDYDPWEEEDMNGWD